MNVNLVDMEQLRIKMQNEIPDFEVQEIENQDIAIIGIYTRFPMAKDTDDFWANLSNGISCVTSFPSNRREDADRYVKFSNRFNEHMPYAKGSFLDRVDDFDYSFFNISPKEALLMNPRQRLFLQAAWSVFEDAGYSPKQVNGSNVGVFVGHISDAEGYVYREMIRELDSTLLPASMPGNLSSIIPSRISYILNLKGPSMLVDTACSSSLVAVDLACQSIRRGECDSAIAGAVRIHLLPQDNEDHKLGIESSDDETRAFDDNADGSGMGEGVAALLLKPLHKAQQDGDHIYCVIKGSASNQDGTSMGITAPNPNAQSEVLVKAWNDAGINPETLSYLETHGTGTILGDPIEIEGITKAFQKYTNKKQFCAIGSVKTNMGHLYDCAGLAGIIKTALILKHRLIPPNLHFNVPNKRIPFVDSPVYVNTKPVEWENEDKPMRCGVSAFGLSGTNCHVVLEEYREPQLEHSGQVKAEHERLFFLSAKNENVLRHLLDKYVEYMTYQTPDWEDLCYTLSVGRGHYAIRIAILANSVSDCLKKISTLRDSDLTVASYPWLFIGVGSRTSQKVIDEGNLNALIKQWNDVSNQTNKDSATTRKELLKSIAEFYVRGADTNWGSLYRLQHRKRISIPTYPFEAKRCWLTIPETYQDKEENPLFYEMEWIQKNGDIPQKRLNSDTILVLGEWPELIGQLKEEGARIIQVRQGLRFQAIDEHSYHIGHRDEDYESLIQDIDQRKIKITKVVHLYSLHSMTIQSTSELDEVQNKGVYCLFLLTKAILNCRINHQVDMYLISSCVNKVSGNEHQIYPEHAPLFGLGKVIGIEYPHISCKAIDLDEIVNAEDIVLEMKRDKGTYQVAFRKGIRFEEAMKEADLDEYEDRVVPIKSEGVYVITGGTGKLGLFMARHLASKEKVNLVLINRTEFPDQRNWKSGEFDSTISEKIKILLEIQSSGSQVECIQTDIASFEQSSILFKRLRSRYGKINGIIHTAGIAGKGFLINKDRSLFENVMRPKVTGTWVLDKVTEQDELDFFVLFSSGVALSGELGQGDYTAANSYLDSFAQYRNRLGKPALSINWVVWENARLEEGNSKIIDGFFKPISVNKALQSFDKVNGKAVSRVLIGEWNRTDESHLDMFNREVFHLPAQINALLSNKKQIDSEKVQSTLAKTEVKLSGGMEGDYNDVEIKLSLLYREVLGYEEFSVHDSFFELGGDSIQLHRLHKLVEKEYPGKLTIADLFAYSSISKLASFLKQGRSSKKSRQIATHRATEEIAIIGMAGYFPGASNVEEFWTNIRNSVESTRKLPKERQAYVDRYIEHIGGDTAPSYMEGGYIDGIEAFDYQFFRMYPKEAKLTDPAQRLFMQAAWNALEDAGYGGNKIRGSRTGVYVGYANVIRDSYQKMLTDIDPIMMSEAIVGNITALIPTRVSHMLDLKGPNMVVDTACSSSLTATHLACNAIRNGDCEMAIVGGIKLFLIPVENENYKIGIESSDGKTRAFDANSDGSGAGEGTAVVILKALSKAKEDGDRIHAVIKASALNQDGTSIGITAPNPQAQTDVILQAWERAGIHPESIAFLEAHGTGTELGDPIEMNGLKHAFEAYTDKKQFCAIGSVKSNIGHLNEAAGMASIVKSVMSLKHREIAPTLFFNNPNSKISFHDGPLYVNNRLRTWEGDQEPMRGAISSFGLSGTNCHMILEEYRNNETCQTSEDKSIGTSGILTISAASLTSLRSLVSQYATHVSEISEQQLRHVCYTSNTGRGHYSYRIAIPVRDKATLCETLLQLAQQEQFGDLLHLGVYYGYHRLISEHRNSKDENNITESEKRQLSNELLVNMQNFHDFSFTDASAQAVCQLYIKGADVPWEELYRQFDVYTVSLPVYPFERTPCWFDLPEKNIAVDKDDKTFTYVSGWKREALMKSDVSEPVSGVIVVVKDESSWADRIINALKAKGNKVLELEYPLFTYSRLNENETDILEYYKAFFDSIAEEGVSKIIYCGSVNWRSVRSLQDLERSQNVGVLSLFLISKAWAQFQSLGKTEFIQLAENVHGVTGRESMIRAEHASLFGLGKALTKEYMNTACRNIDFDEYALEEDILKEVFHGSNRLVALRERQRYVETFEPYKPVASNYDGLTVKDGSVYIITGGTGGIGLETAKHLASKGSVKIVLVNRSEMPVRDHWVDIVEKANDRNLCEKIKGIWEIEQMGSQVILYQADVADHDQVMNMLNDIRLKYGELKGIVHSAGLSVNEPASEKSLHTFRQVLNSKVYGTWLLDELTKQDQLDFFLMYSSVATVFETTFQTDYIAANSYLDAFSGAGSEDGRRRLVINWTTWKDKGMASNHRFQADTIFKTISANQAMSILDTIYNEPVTRLLIGEINYESKMALWMRNYSMQLSDKIADRLNVLDKPSIKNAAKQENHTGDIILLGRKNNNYSEMEKQLAHCCKKVFGFSEIDIYDNFFEMGADSLFLMKLQGEIEATVSRQLTVSELFEHTSIYQLSAYLDEINTVYEPSAEQKYPKMQKSTSKGWLPTSYAQKRLYLANKRDPDSTNSNQFRASIINKHIDPTRMEQAASQMIQRHEILRSAIFNRNGEIVQMIQDQSEFKLEYWESDESTAKEIILGFKRPFNLSAPPLFRMGLIKIKDDRHYLLYDVHHIITDGISIEVFMKELLDFYEQNPVPDLVYQYKDYVEWQQTCMQRDFMKKQGAYWQSIFDGAVPVLQLPTDYVRNENYRYEGDIVGKLVDRGLTQELLTKTKSTGTTMYMLLLAAYSILLSKYSAQEDLVIGSPVSGRPIKELNNILGIFINMIPMRLKPTKDQTFDSYLNQVKQVASRAFDHQDYPMEKLIEALNVDRRVNSHPLFNTIFVYQNINLPDEIFGESVDEVYNLSDFDLTLEATEKDGMLRLKLEYSTCLFNRETVTRMLDDYISILTSITGNAGLQIKNIELSRPTYVNSTSYEDDEDVSFNF